MERMTGLIYPKEKAVKHDRIGRPDKEKVIKDYLEKHPEEKVFL